MTQQSITLGMEDTWDEQTRTPSDIQFLRALYTATRKLDLTDKEPRTGLPTMKVRIIFTSPCEVDSIEIKIYEAQLKFIGRDLEYNVKENNGELQTIKVEAVL